VTHSLRARLLAWVMLPLAGAVAVDAWISHRDASATASVMQDRLLLGSARIVAEQLHFEDGALQQNIPPAALELFEARDVDRIYYRVTTSDGRLITGYEELAVPGVALQPEVPHFFNTDVRGARVRAVAFAQPVLADGGAQTVMVEIAQTMYGHAQLARGLWLHVLSRQLVIVALVALLILFGLHRGLRPLLRLRDAVLERHPGALRPLEAHAVPTELAPLVGAINEYAQRLDRYAGAQRVFVQNAAHQLRTPLTLLTTQVSYGVRSADASVQTESLAAIRQTVQQAVRLVNQLLTLSAAEAQEPDEPAREPEPLDRVVRQVVEDLAGQAQAKAIDLGFEMNALDATVPAHPTVLREIATNLLDNALRYTQRGGMVTCRVDATLANVTLTVEDNGPGIPAAERERVFERFYRVHDRDSGGCGLGLPIVREFAVRMGARVALRVPTNGLGLAVDVSFPRQATLPHLARAEV
jgi:two-component system, OmpR family, sensor histidine kinase TctE